MKVKTNLSEETLRGIAGNLDLEVQNFRQQGKFFRFVLRKSTGSNDRFRKHGYSDRKDGTPPPNLRRLLSRPFSIHGRDLPARSERRHCFRYGPL